MDFDNYNFWDIINKLGWETLCLKGVDKPYNKTKEILDRITDGNKHWQYQISQTAKAYRVILEDKIREYSLKEYGDRYFFPSVSDDTFWDMTAHIVGCGEKTYNNVMSYPKMIETYFYEYVENFEYTFNELK